MLLAAVNSNVGSHMMIGDAAGLVGLAGLAALAATPDVQCVVQCVPRNP